MIGILECLLLSCLASVVIGVPVVLVRRRRGE